MTTKIKDTTSSDDSRYSAVSNRVDKVYLPVFFRVFQVILSSWMFLALNYAEATPHDPARNPRVGVGATSISNLEIIDKQTSDLVSDFYYDFIHPYRQQMFPGIIEQTSDLPANRVLVNGLSNWYQLNSIEQPKSLDLRMRNLKLAFRKLARQGLQDLVPNGALEHVNFENLITSKRLQFRWVMPGTLEFHTDPGDIVALKSIKRNREPGRPLDLGTVYVTKQLEGDALLESLQSLKERGEEAIIPFDQVNNTRNVQGEDVWTLHAGDNITSELGTVPSPHSGPELRAAELPSLSRDRINFGTPTFLNKKTREYRGITIVRMAYLIGGEEEARVTADRLFNIAHPRFDLNESLALDRELRKLEAKFDTLSPWFQNRIKRRYKIQDSPIQHFRSNVIESLGARLPKC